jgi:uncharacterized protein
MKIEGDHIFQGPRQEVWDMFLDPNVLAQALPGTQKLDKIGDDTFEGVMNIRVGPVSGAFSGKVVRSNAVEPDSFTMTVDGKGAPGFLKGSGDVVLGDPGDGTTPMQYSGEVQVGGTLAGVGQRMLDSVSKSMIRAAFDSLDKVLAARLAAKESGGEVEYQAPTEAEFAKSVASDMASSMFSGSKGRIMLYVGAVLVVVLLLALIFSRAGGGM